MRKVAPLRRLHLIVLAVPLLAISLLGQTAQPRTLLPDEPTPNLGELKIHLTAYHNCVGDDGCYATDLDHQSDAALQARPVELWVQSLVLASKSRAHVRGLLKVLWDFAMWRGHIPTQRNPMELVTIRGATKRSRQPRSLTVDEFRMFVQHLEDPFRTMALLCACLGLRISECLALKWSDIDWLNGRLRIERGIVYQQVEDVKTRESHKRMVVDDDLLELLKVWKQTTQFSTNEDWIFASPVQLGRLPWSYDQVWRMYQKAATGAGIGRLGTHSLRHTYRSWLDSVGTPVGVQQKLMRHADVRTTMSYGDAMTGHAFRT